MKKLIFVLSLLAGCASVPSEPPAQAASSVSERETDSEKPSPTPEISQRYTVVNDHVDSVRFIFQGARDFIDGYYSLTWSTSEQEGGKLEGIVYCEDAAMFAGLKEGDAVQADFIKVRIDFGDKQMVCSKVTSLTPAENDFYNTNSRTLASFLKETPTEIELHYYVTVRQDEQIEDHFYQAAISEPQDIEDFLQEMEAITIYKDAIPVYGAGIPFQRAVFTYADGSTYEISECLMVYPGGTKHWDEYGYASGQEELFSALMRSFAEGRDTVTITPEEHTY